MITEIAEEKTQKSLFDGIEKFDASRLKHTETQEKNPLPDKDGTFLLHRQLASVTSLMFVIHISFYTYCYRS